MNKPRIDDALVARVQGFLAEREARPLPQNFTRPELKVTAQAEGQPGAELLIYDEIGFWGIWAVDVAAALSTLSGPLHVRISSPGGDVFDGVAIYNMLADYPDQVTVTVDSLAASAASFIAMAGDTIRMNRASQMMIHDASGGCRGNAADMKAMAGLLDVISGTIAGIYASRAGGEVEEWRERMLVDGGFGTWYTAEEAVEAGLADELVPLPASEQEPDVDQAAARAVAALFPYGVDDAGRWRLAAFAPPAGQASAPGAPSPPVEAHTPQPPLPAESIPEPAPAPPQPVVEPVAVEPEPEPEVDGWASATAHLITPPSSQDVWESLKEALLR
jgi:ATP-dependent protease ClpP protease subunit